MEEKNYTAIVPPNVEGKEITSEALVSLRDANEAKALYKTARERLLFVHSWGKITGTLSADFQLTDGEGNEVDRLSNKGDHFRIDIAGPGSHEGGGYDWAYVEDIREVNEGDVDSVAITVRPAANPKTDSNNVAHFYSGQSTSTFVVTREGNKVTASIYDRNIEPNQETKSVIDKARNAVVGLGAKHGFSKMQWQALAEALIKKEE